MGVYQNGNVILIDETFYVETVPGDFSTAVPTDPTTVVFTLRDPSDTLTTYTFGVDVNVTNPSVGRYICELASLTLAGEWHFRIAGTGAVQAAEEGEFTILASSVLAPVIDDPVNGPYTSWCDSQDVSLICPGSEGSDFTVFDQAAVEASMVLFELSGRQYWGLSQPVTVRPCATRCGCWGQWVGMTYPWAGLFWTITPWSGIWQSNQGDRCGCAPMSRVKLAGYPVREIVEVKVNGSVVDPADYRLDGFKWLTRLRDPANPQQRVFWPGCQILDLEDTEEGTFSVQYRHGMDPPVLGSQAAAELACQIYRAATGGDCDLPQSVVSVSRQGVTIQRAPFVSWGMQNGQWVTGMPLVDMFLSSYNPAGLRRRPAVWSPDLQSFAKKLG